MADLIALEWNTDHKRQDSMEKGHYQIQNFYFLK
mgnify:FL=1